MAMPCCFKGEDYDNEPYSPATERSSLLNNNPPGSRFRSVDEFLRHNKDDNVLNMWTNPDDTSHSIEDDDRELYTLLIERESAKDKRVYDEAIRNIRDKRNATQERWKAVLKSLGFDKEAKRLLYVQSIAHASDPSKDSKAHEYLNWLRNETGIFGDGSVQAKRYLVVLERLEDLDVAESFVSTAISLYPKPD